MGPLGPTRFDIRSLGYGSYKGHGRLYQAVTAHSHGHIMWQLHGPQASLLARGEAQVRVLARNTFASPAPTAPGRRSLLGAAQCLPCYADLALAASRQAAVSFMMLPQSIQCEIPCSLRPKCTQSASVTCVSCSLGFKPWLRVCRGI